MSDLALARRLIRGDESAFDAFFADYFPRLFRFARTRVATDDAAEDVAQSTLLKAIEKLHTYRGEAALSTWLCTLCRHEIGAWLARTGAAGIPAPIDDEVMKRAALDALAAVWANDPDATLRRREVSWLVHATLDHLPPHYGTALEWKYIQELSVDEIATRLGIGYKAAESLLTRAREAFREGFLIVAGSPEAV